MIVRSDETLRQYLLQRSATKGPHSPEEIDDNLRDDDCDFNDFQNDYEEEDLDLKPKPEELHRSLLQQQTAKDDTSNGATEPMQFECHLCSKSLDSMRSLRLHIRLHNQSDDESDQPLAHFKVKREHDETTTIEAKISDILGKSSKSSMENDAFYQLGESNGKKVAICKICDQRFKRVSALRTHLLGHATLEESFENVSLEKRASLCENQTINPDEFILWIQLQLQVNLPFNAFSCKIY